MSLWIRRGAGTGAFGYDAGRAYVDLIDAGIVYLTSKVLDGWRSTTPVSVAGALLDRGELTEASEPKSEARQPVGGRTHATTRIEEQQ